MPHLRPGAPAQSYLVQLRQRHGRDVAGVRRLGAASLDLAYVAAGRIDGYLGNRLAALGHRRRHAAGARGGRPRRPLEGDDDLLDEGTIVAGNPDIYDRLRGLLEEVG